MAHSLLDRGASISLCLMLLLPSLAAAAGPPPLGTLRSNGSVFVDTTVVPAETSLFSGDQIRTEDGRASLALPHGSSILIERSSKAVLQKISGGLSIGLEEGRLTFNSNPRTPIRVQVGDLAVRPTGEFPSLAEVAMLRDGSVVLSVHRGTVSVRKSQEESVLVKAGDQLTVEPQALRKDDTPGTAAHGSSTMGQKVSSFHLSHGASVALIGVAVVATAAAIAIPIATNNDETPVSPSVP